MSGSSSNTPPAAAAAGHSLDGGGDGGSGHLLSSSAHDELQGLATTTTTAAVVVASTSAVVVDPLAAAASVVPNKKKATNFALEESLVIGHSQGGQALEHHHTGYDDDDEEDAELQAALALSLQQTLPSSSNNNNATVISNILLSDQKPAAVSSTPPLPSSASFVMRPLEEEAIPFLLKQYHDSAQPLPVKDVKAFHELMWDARVTTRYDQLRWMGQGIATRPHHEEVKSIHHQQSTTNPPMIATVAASHLPWGLTQQFGGPCGVLAAIQAEVLRLLLYGGGTTSSSAPQAQAAAEEEQRRQDDDYEKKTTLDYPPEDLLQRQEEENSFPYYYYFHEPCITPKLMEFCLARAIGMILARAALSLQPVVVKPCGGDEKACNTDNVKIILPTLSVEEPELGGDPPPRTLHWSDLEPWPACADQPATKEPVVTSSTKLTVYTISLPETSVVDTAGHNKRQKKMSANNNNKDQQHVVPREERIRRLASAVGDFLFYQAPPPSSSSSSDAMETDDSATTSSRRPRRRPLSFFQRDGGVLLLAMSLVATRRPQVVQEDMDDVTSCKLTSQFGHCAQELMNLLLSGQAVSNVFDNTMKPSGDMELRGIQQRPVIGYLTQLESLRLCQVGSYYKSPQFPIWVVGSTSHFTVLFGAPNALFETQSDKLLEKCQRAFKAVGDDENGFIPTDKLGTVLESLEVDLTKGSTDPATAVQTLAASLEVSGAGIIIWDDFWKTTSRLLTGASLEQVLAAGDGVPTSIVSDNAGNDANNGRPPLLITDGKQNETAGGGGMMMINLVDDDGDEVPPLETTMETDEQMARRLAQEWESGDSSAVAARVTSPMQVDTAAPASSTALSDEELARKLQAEWDAEITAAAGGAGDDNASQIALQGEGIISLSGDGDNDLTNAFGTNHRLSPTPPPPPPPTGSNSNSTSTTAPMSSDSVDSKPAAKMFETYGDTFDLFHYNGLRGGVLTPLQVTRLTPEEAVGASIAMVAPSSSSNNNDCAGGDLENVLRTKWPSCRINWMGKAPPYIN